MGSRVWLLLLLACGCSSGESALFEPGTEGGASGSSSSSSSGGALQVAGASMGGQAEGDAGEAGSPLEQGAAGGLVAGGGSSGSPAGGQSGGGTAGGGGGTDSGGKPSGGAAQAGGGTGGADAPLCKSCTAETKICRVDEVNPKGKCFDCPPGWLDCDGPEPEPSATTNGCEVFVGSPNEWKGCPK